ncbi:MAG TPA: NAD-dependent epimerase/dehydratase family protein [Polyangiaceae bacterium]|nr:NAD-dependent epimerase/dehydratase family protein [Polyangiaceae bacterium]
MSVSRLVWVIGAGGLLGSSVRRELDRDAWRASQPFNWTDPERLRQDFSDAVRAFCDRLAAEPGRAWAIAWCAGAGVVATSAQALAAETVAFQHFLTLLAAEPELGARPGCISLASSAGGVYGGCFVSPITEATPPQPISPYGFAKLEQEQLLMAWAASQPNVSVVIARFSNLYGPGQRLDKPQGLVSHASRCLIYGAPLHVYVSTDTIRDYLFAEDAGHALVVVLRRVGYEKQLPVIKLIASEKEISISGLLGVFRQISRRKLRVVAGLHRLAVLQPKRLQFRSQVWPDPTQRNLELVEGVSRVYRRQLADFAKGRLPSPVVRKA